jgi:hypothetical protein
MNHVGSKQAGSEADGVRYGIAHFECEIKKVFAHIAHPTSIDPYYF